MFDSHMWKSFNCGLVLFDWSLKYVSVYTRLFECKLMLVNVDSFTKEQQAGMLSVETACWYFNLLKYDACFSAQLIDLNIYFVPFCSCKKTNWEMLCC